MNENFNLDGGHEIDDLFRNALSNHTESPSNDAWSKLNHKLNRKEVVDFVTLKKVPGTDGISLPLYRQQWFRVTAAASVALLILFSSFFIVKRTVNKLDNSNKNIANRNTDQHSKTPYGVDDYTNITGYNAVNPEPFNNAVSKDDFLAQNKNRVEGLNKMSVNHENNNSLQHLNDQNAIADNNNKINKNRNNNNQINNSNDNQANSNNQNVYLPNNSISNNNQPIIADNSNNNVNPIVGINNQNNQNNNNQNDSNARNQAANAVDSLIHANAIKDSLLLLINDQNLIQNNGIDSTDEEISFPDQVNGVNNNENQALVPGFPSSFSPNGDGLNDYLYVKNIEYFPDNTLIIMDRRGKKVFEKKEYRGDWNAQGVTDGTYFYVFTYKNEKNQSCGINGFLYIIR
jgi:gliding motility-associated-like protein